MIDEKKVYYPRTHPNWIKKTEVSFCDFTHRFCMKCSKAKELSLFTTNKKAFDGKRSICMSCSSRKSNDHWKGNKEKYYYQFIRYKYNLTKESYDSLINFNEGRCWICNIPHSKSKRRPNIDHCHKSGAVRGLLCRGCNYFLGNINDKKSTLNLITRNALRYLSDNGETVRKLIEPLPNETPTQTNQLTLFSDL